MNTEKKRLPTFLLFGISTAVLVVFDQWTKAGLITPVGDWMVQTVAGQFWHTTMAQLLVNVLGKRLAQTK